MKRLFARVILGLFLVSAITACSGEYSSASAPREASKNNRLKQAQSKAYWNAIAVMAEAQLDSIEFYAKVVDQYGEPIPRVEVEFDAQSSYLAAGSGLKKTQANQDGSFVIRGVNGSGLGISKLHKSGYAFDLYNVHQFYAAKRFPESLVWKDHSSPENPYIFQGWKVEGLAEIEMGRFHYTFIPDGRVYSVDLRTKKKGVRKQEGEDLGSFNVSFVRDDTHWHLMLSVPGADLLSQMSEL